MAGKKQNTGTKAKKGTAAGKPIDMVVVRMYRPGGTGDFFLLFFKQGGAVRYKMLIDCGCIDANKDTFPPTVNDLASATEGTIDLLVLTHEHEDHINGFQKAANLFKDRITVKKVWLAWTENLEDPDAVRYRKEAQKMAMAIAEVAGRMNGIVKENYYRKQFQGSPNAKLMEDAQHHYIRAMNSFNNLNALAAKGKNYTMETFLKDNGVIGDGTQVRYCYPGDTLREAGDLPGIRFFVLGPPKDFESLKRMESSKDQYNQRQEKGEVDFTFINALGNADDGDPLVRPFKNVYAFQESEDPAHPIVHRYKGELWRAIDHDWLYTGGSLALKYDKILNNTSLALAIQFDESGKVLLFPGDAQYGNWASWHEGLTWETVREGKREKVDAADILGRVVFYKVGHHLADNGTPKSVGLERMTSPELTAMVPLDYQKIRKGWLSTMPNDEIGALLLKKTGGKVLISGNCAKILEEINTNRVTVYSGDDKACRKQNKAFDKKLYLECEVEG